MVRVVDDTAKAKPSAATRTLPLTMDKDVSPPVTLKIADIRTDGGTQTRAVLSQDVVDDYRDLWLEGVRLPAVQVVHDGTNYWLWDGFHRVHGARAAGITDIKATVRQGTQRDAILRSVGANADHGLRRTGEDKRRAVSLLLTDAEWSKWSDRVIAEKCGVGNQLVSVMRAQLCESHSSKAPEARIGKDGKSRKAPKPPKQAAPLATVTDLAEERALRERAATAGDSNWTVANHRAVEDEISDALEGLVYAPPAEPLPFDVAPAPEQVPATSLFDAAAHTVGTMLATGATEATIAPPPAAPEVVKVEAPPAATPEAVADRLFAEGEAFLTRIEKEWPAAAGLRYRKWSDRVKQHVAVIDGRDVVANGVALRKRQAEGAK